MDLDDELDDYDGGEDYADDGAEEGMTQKLVFTFSTINNKWFTDFVQCRA